MTVIFVTFLLLHNKPQRKAKSHMRTLYEPMPACVRSAQKRPLMKRTGAEIEPPTQTRGHQRKHSRRFLDTAHGCRSHKPPGGGGGRPRGRLTRRPGRRRRRRRHACPRRWLCPAAHAPRSTRRSVSISRRCSRAAAATRHWARLVFRFDYHPPANRQPRRNIPLPTPLSLEKDQESPSGLFEPELSPSLPHHNAPPRTQVARGAAAASGWDARDTNRAQGTDRSPP